MKKSHFIPAFLLSAALLSGLAGCKKETEYYNPNAQTSSVTETQTELQTEPSTQASTEESTEASTEESTEASTEESTAAHVVSKELAVGDIWYVNTDSLNIRDYPSTEGNKIGELYRGEEVRILALAENGWGSDSQCNNGRLCKSRFSCIFSRSGRWCSGRCRCHLLRQPQTKHQMQTHLLQTDILCALMQVISRQASANRNQTVLALL